MTAGSGLRTLIQSLVFFVVARELGIADYGAYTALLALAGTLGTFGGLGLQGVMVRDVARDQGAFGMAWGHTLAGVAISFPLLFPVYLASALVFLPADLSMVAVVLVGLSELLATPVALGCITAYQGHGQISRASWIFFAQGLPRLAGAVILLALAPWLARESLLTVWAGLYTAAGLAGAGYGYARVHRDLGPAVRPHWPAVLSRLKVGLALAVSLAATKLYADIDKVMLAYLSTLEATGAYSAGYRVIDFAILPIAALFNAAAPRFFREGAKGISLSLRYSRRILPWVLGFGLFSGGVLYTGAPLLPVVLGAGYQPAVSALQWLACLPIVSLPRMFLQTLLVTSDRQNVVVTALLGGSALNIVLNFWLIPVWDWRGAVFATYAAEVVMGGVMVASVMRPERTR